MTTQLKTVSKVCVIVLLVAAFLFTAFSGCFDSVAYAAGTITYQVNVVDSSKATISTLADKTKTNASGNLHYYPASNPWFDFDGWYLESSRNNKVSHIMDGSSTTRLYGAYVFKYGAGDVNGDGKVDTNDITRYCEKIVGGYDVVEVPEGKEWEYSQNSEYTKSGVKLFFARNAKVYNNSTSNVLNLTYLRMAIVGGYGLDVLNGAVLGSSDYTTVYFYNAHSWTARYLHVWSDEGDYTKWPGLTMTSIGNNWYSAQIPKNLTHPKVIFNNNSGAQTPDLVFEQGTPYFAHDTWYSSQPSNLSTRRIYFYNNQNWSSVKLYYWGSESNSWPGTDMNFSNLLQLYYYDMPTGATSMIFNNGLGGDSNQTVDITVNTSTPFYQLTNLSGKWNYSAASTLLTFSSVYYYNPQVIGEVYAYFNNKSTKSVKMTAVKDDPGWYSCSVPTIVSSIAFGSATAKWDTTTYMDYNNPYYAGGWKSESSRYTSSYMIIDGVRYQMLYGNGEDTLFKVYLEKDAEVKVYWRNGVGTTLDSYSTNVSYVSSSVFRINANGYYDFYCKDNGKQVYVGYQASY